MGKALYRKYRSKNFDEVIGQEHITDTLKNAIKKGAISHAYLFTGPRGTGKTSIARILAHIINDIDYNDESTHLDIIEIDAASNRRIDEIRDLRDKVHIAPTSSKYKVYIIDEVHMLTREAFNALLKTLEEPPEHVVFILATTEAHKVPETIISRTQKFTFRPIEQSKVVEHLRAIAVQEKLKINDEALQLLAEHGSGSFRDSISMLDQLAGLVKDTVKLEDVQLLLGIPDNTIIDEVLLALASKNVQEIFDSIQSLRIKGVNSGRAALSISEVVRNGLINKDKILEQKIAIKLLQNLLPISNSSNDFIGLELALLDVMQTVGDNHLKPTNKMSEVSVPAVTIQKNLEPIKKQKTEEVEEKKENTGTSNNTGKNNSVKVSKKSDLNDEILNKEVWSELLNSLKKKHNTLYGILRMAVPSQRENKIVLQFNFGFHKKQIDIPHNATILREFIKTYFNTTEYETITSKSIINKTVYEAPNLKKNNDGVIESVSNIFGGAELLE